MDDLRTLHVDRLMKRKFIHDNIDFFLSEMSYYRSHVESFSELRDKRQVFFSLEDDEGVATL